MKLAVNQACRQTDALFGRRKDRKRIATDVHRKRKLDIQTLHRLTPVSPHVYYVITFLRYVHAPEST
jgi:hypothetical protein